MIFSTNTLNILKNFSSINQSLWISSGSKIKTIQSGQESIFAFASVEERFETEFGIYDLSQFIRVVSAFVDPDIIFYDKYLEIIKDKQKVKYIYCDKKTIKDIPQDFYTKEFYPPPFITSFKLPQDIFQKGLMVISQLGLPQVCFKSDGNVITFSGTDIKNPTTNIYSVELGETSKKFNVILNKEYMLKLLSLNYMISIAKGITEFKSSQGLSYYIFNQMESKYEL
jgi:hypothetical protein